MDTKANRPEETHATLHEDMTDAPGEQPLTGSAEEARRSTRARQYTNAPGEQQGSTGRKSRRGVLRKWLVGAAAAVGAGALLRANTGTALADGNEGPTVFTAVQTIQPAVTAISQTENHWAIESTGPIGIITYSDEVPAPYPPGGVAGLVAASDTGYAIYATGAHGGPLVYSTNSNGFSGSAGMQGTSSGSGIGVIGTSDSNIGVQGTSRIGTGVEGIGSIGVQGIDNSGSGFGVFGTGGIGVAGVCKNGLGVAGTCSSGTGVRGLSDTGTGVLAGSKVGSALIVVGHMKVQGDSVGQAILTAGNTTVTVTTAAATLSSNILLTPLGNPNGSLWVTRANGSFTINASAAQGSSLPVAYLIIN